jgi:Ca-activated chloride channel family protein
MDAASGLTFAYPERLWLALLAVPLFLLLVRQESVRRTAADRFISERMRGLSNGLRSVRPYIIIGAVVAGVLAAAGPQLGFELREAPTVEANTLIVLDLSASMDVRDVGASRLVAGKALARRIIDRSPGRVGLVVYEGTAEVIAPLTDDHSAVVTLLDSLRTGELAEAGSDLSKAIEVALALAETGGTRSTEAVIISDGEHRGRAWDEQLAIARTRGLRISAIVIGTSDGGGVPDGSGGELADEEGNLIVSRASTEPLATIADECGGTLWINPFGEETLLSLQRDFGEFTGSDRFDRIPKERYQWPLGVSVLLFLVSLVANRGAQ